MAAIPLLIKYLKGEASPEEALYIEQWASSSPEHQGLLNEAWHRWHSVIGEGGESIPDPYEEWKSCRQRFFKKGGGKVSLARWLRAPLFQAATVILLLAVAGWFISVRMHQVSPVPAVPAKLPERPQPQQAPVKVGMGKRDSTHLYDFRNISIEEAIQVLSRDYGIRFIATNPQILKCRFTTVFDHESLTYILDVVTETLNISYEYSPDRQTIYLSGKGCE